MKFKKQKGRKEGRRKEREKRKGGRTKIIASITSLIYVLKSGSVCPPTVCFVNYVFAILDSLDCHINSRISLSSSSNQTSQDFDKACTASVDQYTEN